MFAYTDKKLIDALEQYAYPLNWGIEEYDPVVRAAEGKQFVLMGEATHGTHEFYRARAEITIRLIEELGFDAVAVEADWPDAYTINRYVSGLHEDINAYQSLKSFERFPTWMWRNREVLQFVEWLHGHNAKYDHKKVEKPKLVGFYGLDLYSMTTSINAVIQYLETIDPQAAGRARERYGCMDHYMNDPQAYGYAAEYGLAPSCEDEIIEQLIELRHKEYTYMQKNGFVAAEEYFCAEQNAKLVRNAEEYYRSMFRGRVSSWNIRDKHMFETLNDLAAHISEREGRPAKIIVWAHNSHIGNAAATEVSKQGEYNIGQLVRQKYGDKALLLGFSTHHGTVSAASDWDGPVERKRVRPAIPGSYEDVFHHVNYKHFLVNLREDNRAVDLLDTPRLQRAIGVIYRPETERQSHYYYARLPEQFDMMLHFDETTAVEPMEPTTYWHRGEMDETYPSGF